MNVIVLGGDGFCGWPTALNLSEKGYQVIIIDNFSRRNIDLELGTQSLTPIALLEERLSVWKALSGNEIQFYNIDLSDEYEALLSIINQFRPQAIIHFAEQRSAPYSMKTSGHKRYTVNNNLNVTNNICSAIVESEQDIHLVHLGTMGVYGYGTAGLKIPEGYLQIDLVGNEKHEFLYPANPGSIYHMTKTQDQLMFLFYNKNDNVRITDLHQGIVWGTQTDQTKLDPALVNRFDYDGDFGTVLNRFLMQAAVGHPLTVHGEGGQTRAFIHINDTVKCIEIALNNPPDMTDKVKIYNQMTETYRVKDLAILVAEITGSEINYLPNPRNEDAQNELFVDNACFINEGLKPTTLRQGLLEEIYEIAVKYKSRCDLSKIRCQSYWNKHIADSIKKNK